SGSETANPATVANPAAARSSLFMAIRASTCVPESYEEVRPIADGKGDVQTNARSVRRPQIAEGLALQHGDGVDAQLAQFEQPVELTAAEGRLLAAALHFDELAGPGHDQVKIDV